MSTKRENSISFGLGVGLLAGGSLSYLGVPEALLYGIGLFYAAYAVWREL